MSQGGHAVNQGDMSQDRKRFHEVLISQVRAAQVSCSSFSRTP
ncbi:hypothetical protein ACCUM_2638 [Candidatus Accumulibacter phosphatis]|uniref:Uncharacterized protein n=1 Tax=Candidatus Accumulibacter phosphatis TaxID=327160 RepID=A0A5S4EQT3_9PROT|nr:hypothetical protein ACCUM_2638 [Candidatus Accumulibacter phosphatis]